MKSKDQVLRRLEKLINRYRLKHIEAGMEKTPENCVHNLEVPDHHSVANPEDLMLAPRRSVTLVVLNNLPGTSRVCTYGGDQGQWNGTICDRASISGSCPKFTCRASADLLGQEFDFKMQDDDFVLTRFPDVAALQWVSESRPWSFKRNVWGPVRILLDRLLGFIKGG